MFIDPETATVVRLITQADFKPTDFVQRESATSSLLPPVTASTCPRPQNPKIGVVLNFISLRSAAYYGYYGYYGDAKYECGKVSS